MCNTDLVREAVNKHRTVAVELSDCLAANPELSGKEYEASRKMTDILKNAWFTVEYPYDGLETAFCAELHNGDGPVVAILAEYDALPEIGHGCGHNVHGSMSILAGLALIDLRDHFQGKLCIIGTPAEEVDGAKIKMCDDGVFEDMDLAMMIHSSYGQAEPAMRCLALKCYNFEFYGQTAHAAACPWEGRNALTAARKFLDLLDGRRQCFMPDVRISSVFLDGGKRTNIIPDYAKVQVEFRAESFPRLEGVTDSVIKCARGAALAFDCDVKWERAIPDYSDLVTNSPAENAISEIFESLGVKVGPCSRASGSSDIGNVSYHCPAIHPLLPIADEVINLHTAEFAKATARPRAHEALATGAEAMALMALSVFNDADLRTSIREEFNRQMKYSL